MALIMGIDTGGTYTDGVIADPADKKVLCKAKALTTKWDLTIGISRCIEGLHVHDIRKVTLVCLSTTLATNAIVEGRYGRVGLLLIGKAPEGKLPIDSWELLRGKFDIKGKEKEAIREDEVYRAVENLRNRVDAVAISGYASVRNPGHELEVKRMVRERLDIPVVCAHELSCALGFYDRTVTAVLNAGLIPIISDLIKAVKSVLRSNSIDAPIMLVKGDGSLMEELFAVDRPIETILSGPAASIMGGLFLTNQKDAVIVDMGGTTTDIANLEDGKVKVRKKGAKVGGWHTQVQAAEICTFGIGGDSYLHFGANGELRIGPQRAHPLCIAGWKYPELIYELKTIGEEEGYELFSEKVAECFSLVKRPENRGLSGWKEDIIRILGDGPHSLYYLTRVLGKDAGARLLQLERQGIVEKIWMTPTDILHALGRYNEWDEEISRVGAEIMAKRTRKTVSEFLETAVLKITERLAVSCQQSQGDFEEPGFTEEEKEAARFLAGKSIIAIGAPVTAWMPGVCDRLNTRLIIPEHAEVANAIGAATGQVMETVEALIRPEKENKGYILHAPWGRMIFDTLEEAMGYAVPAAKEHISKLLRLAGSDRFEVAESHEHICANVSEDAAKMYIETRIKVSAMGSPRWISS
jgi:N-methylhydantoinase A/oxoprolinase/acetone carboxylase beta subunit